MTDSSVCDFDKLRDQSESLAIGCPGVGGGKTGYTLSKCMKEACQGAGNAVNFKGEACYIKRCEKKDYGKHLNNGWGGWNIYVKSGEILQITKLFLLSARTGLWCHNKLVTPAPPIGTH